MPYINQNFIDDLPNKIDIVNLINKRLPLKKTGSDYRAPCPFHNGKNRNFSVSSSKQFYHCFKCGESGGAISFVQKFDNLDFVDAIKTIASEFGIDVVYDKNVRPVDMRLQRYRDLLQKVSEFYIKQLKASPGKNKAVVYAKKRGISGEIAKRFSLGFATPNNNDLLTYFKDNTQDMDDLKTLGIIKNGDYGDYDFFRDRLIFPIHNSRGKVIAFGGRALDNKAKAKYLNSSESPVFSKSKELYGIYHARKYSRSMDYILVVEGYMDVVAMHQGGFTLAVATLGTATTPQHLQILTRTTNLIIFCFDGDEAGRTAAVKALKVSLPIIKSGIIIKFLFLPDGEDPDTLIKKESSNAFKKRIDNAHTLSKFLFDYVKSMVDFNTIEGKTLFLEKTLALVNQVSYDTYKQQLLEGVAVEVGQNIKQVKNILKQQKQKKSYDAPPAYAEPPIDSYKDLDNLEQQEEISTKPEHIKNNPIIEHMIGLVLNYPAMVDETIEHRVRKIKDSDMLLELTNSAMLTENVSLDEMIKPFPKQKQYLLTLYDKEKHNNYDYKSQFLDALLKAEKKQEKIEALLIKDEKEYVKNLQKRKGKK